MKKGSFKGLVFREFYVARKTIIGYFLAYVGLVILALLTLLSFKCGNLHRYAHLLNEDGKKYIDSLVRLTPAMFAMLLTSGACDATPNDEKLPWRHFRTACPVTPFRLALAKYTCTMIIFLFSIGFSFGWLGLHSLLTGTALTRDNIVIIAVAYSFILILIAYAQNVGIWLRTLEKTLIAILIPTYGGMFLLIFKFPDVMFMMDPTNPTGMEKLVEGCNKLLPFSPLIFVGSLLVGILFTTMLYRRREK